MAENRSSLTALCIVGSRRTKKTVSDNSSILERGTDFVFCLSEGEKQTDRQTDRQTLGQTARQTETDRQKGRERKRQTDRQTDRQG